MERSTRYLEYHTLPPESAPKHAPQPRMHMLTKRQTNPHCTPSPISSPSRLSSEFKLSLPYAEINHKLKIMDGTATKYTSIFTPGAESASQPVALREKSPVERPVVLRASPTVALGEKSLTRRHRRRVRALWHCCRADHSWRHGRKIAAGTLSAARKKARSQPDERKGWGWGSGSGI